MTSHSSHQRTALFAGSFNPFTTGHLRIVERCLHIADRVVVAVGYNEHKDAGDIDSRVEALRRIFKDRPDVEVTSYSGLTADFARNVGADFLLRGVRGNADFEYERNLADINLNVLGMDTVILVSEPQYAYISSSAVRELRANGYDVTPFLPPLQ